MSLADFMRDLQSQDGGVYSEVPEQPVRVIPPEQTAVRIIAPETAPVNRPTKIKLKLNPPTSNQPAVQPVVQTQPVKQAQPKPQVSQNVVNTSVAPKPDYFAQAKASKKHNPIVDRMRVGRFTITPDNKVLILPDYDVVGKDPDDVLKDSWF